MTVDVFEVVFRVWMTIACITIVCKESPFIGESTMPKRGSKNVIRPVKIGHICTKNLA